MRAYVGQTRAPELVALLAAAGIGECTVTGELGTKGPRRRPFFHDNGAYRAWQAAGEPIGAAAVAAIATTFPATRWVRDQRWLGYRGIVPDFVVVPDIVTGGLDSLAFSAQWRPEVFDGFPAYLAVQNGMTEADVVTHLDELAADGYPYAGLFVGGDDAWKLETAPAWVDLAHARGLRCHIGRVGPADRIRWAHAIGADSIDSCLPLLQPRLLGAFLEAVAEAADVCAEVAA